jgi:hypothetical protein
MPIQLPNGKNYFEATGGGPAVGYKLFAYVPGTSTPKDTYTTSVGNVANTHPVVMDARGEAAIYWDGSYDVSLYTAADALVWGPERLEDSGDTLRTDLASTASASVGAGLSGFSWSLYYAASTVGWGLRTAKTGRHIFEVIPVAQWANILAGTSTYNAATDFQTIIDSMEARGGGVIWFPAGHYQLEAVVLMKRGVKLIGEGCKKPGGTYDGITIFHGVHTGAAVVSFKGAHECEMEGIMVYGDQTTTPKTGILCGRSSASSAGLHKFSRVHVDGYYSEACYYLIASESNSWSNIFYTLRGGGALYGIYASQGDDLAVDSLTGSSNLENSFFHLEGINMTDDAAATGVHLSAGSSTGSWAFYSPYLIQHKGSYFALSAGLADGNDGLGPFIFSNASGEVYDQAGGGAPQQGFNLLGTTALRGLQISGGRFQFVNSTGSERSMKMAAGVSLKQPHVSLQTMDNATAELVFSNIDDGYVSVGAQSFTAPTLTNSWTDSIATSNGIQTPGYYRDPMGFVHLRGFVGAGTVNSAMFTLPAGYRPGTTEVFGCLNGASNVIGRVDVGSDGTVNLRTGGSNTYVDLSGITFKAV